MARFVLLESVEIDTWNKPAANPLCSFFLARTRSTLCVNFDVTQYLARSNYVNFDVTKKQTRSTYFLMGCNSILS